MRCTISRFASEPSLCRERCGDGLVAVLECFKWMRLGWHSLGGEDQQDPPRTWGSRRGWSSAGRDPRLGPATPLRHERRLGGAGYLNTSATMTGAVASPGRRQRRQRKEWEGGYEASFPGRDLCTCDHGRECEHGVRR